jgi:hypothetical protein
LTNVKIKARYYKIPPFDVEKPEDIEEEKNEKKLSSMKFVIVDKSKY